MPRSRYDEPDEEEEDDYDPDWDTGDDYNPEDPETYPEGLYDDDGPPTVPCPHCHADILEDSQQCPECGTYISREDAPSSGSSASSAWWIVMILALGAALMWALGWG